MNRNLIIPFVVYLTDVCLTTKNETELADSDVSDIKHVLKNWANWTSSFTFELCSLFEGRPITSWGCVSVLVLYYL